MSKPKADQSETQRLIERVRNALPGIDLAEKRMFGGVCLMLNGNMLCHASKKGLMVRVGKEAEAQALQLPHASPCDGAGHRMPGFIMIAPEGLERGLAKGIRLALEFVSALPPKEKAPKASARKPKLVSLRK
jgi:TfoX/Sxy family transcriptional regulator of competence genes